MSRTLFLFLSLCYAVDCFATDWEQTSLTSRYINVLYVDEFGHVYAATQGDSIFFRSVDHGATWQTVSSPRPSPSSYAGPSMFAVNQAGDLFVANHALGLHRSSDVGATWSANLTAEACASIAVAGWGDLFAGLTYTGNGKVFRSTNNGDSWTYAVLPGQPSFATLNYQFNSAGDVFAQTISGVYKSTDNGGSWTHVTSGLARSLAVSPFSDAMVVCDNLMRSTDRGETWDVITPIGIPQFDHIEGLVFGSDGILYGKSNSFVLQSSDLGSTWTNSGTGLTTGPECIAGGDGYIFVGTFQGVFRKSIAVSAVDDATGNIPGNFSLDNNYPNPFNPSTTISFNIPYSSFVSLRVFDVLGKEVAVLVNEVQSSGRHSVEFSADGLTSGVYFYRLQSKDFVQTQKMILLR